MMTPARIAQTGTPNIITKVAMITRFTTPEFTGVLTAAKTDVDVEAWYVLFTAAGSINLDDPRTASGVYFLATKNLLTQERAVEIATDPVQPPERP
jgi:hypothetical protein